MATLLGAVGGIAAAFAREHLHAVFVSAGQIERELGTSCLGIFPALANRRRHLGAPRGSGSVSHDRNRADEFGQRTILRDHEGYTRAVDDPFSPWSEAVRFLAADIIGLNRPVSAIGVGSALAGEGKSMTAASLAELIADAGRKVLLVDCNLRNPELTRRLTPQAAEGLLDAIAGTEARLQDFVWRDPVTGLDFLPAPPPLISAVHPSGALSSLQMRRLLTSAQDIYDHVIVDFPAILPVADVKTASHLVDSFVLVIEWGKTSQSAVRDALNTAPLIASKLLGAVLNKASPSSLERLDSYSK